MRTIDVITSRFKSANEIPVSRAWITNEEWGSIIFGLSRLREIEEASAWWLEVYDAYISAPIIAVFYLPANHKNYMDIVDNAYDSIEEIHEAAKKELKSLLRGREG